MGSTLRVTETGRLLGLDVRVEGRLRGPSLGLRGVPDLAFTGQLTGEVRGSRFFPRLQVHALWSRSAADARGGLLDKPLDLAPVAVSAHGSVLLPLHPVNRIQGLRPGQHWRQPVVDPLADSLALFKSLAPAGEARFLDATVRPRGQILSRQGRPTPCLVIDYRGEEMEARTWVEEDSGLVLRQEVTAEGGHWVMRREG
jgi:hypothetical protein